jgi:hypothetical protein
VSSLPPSIIGNISTASPTFDQAANIFDKLFSSTYKGGAMEQIPEEKSPISEAKSSPRASAEYKTIETVSAAKSRQEEAAALSPTSKAISTGVVSTQSPKSKTTAWTSDSSGHNPMSDLSPLYSVARSVAPTSPQPSRQRLPPASRHDTLAAALMDADSDDDEARYSTSASLSDDVSKHTSSTDDDDSIGDDVKKQQIESILDGLRSAEERINKGNQK